MTLDEASQVYNSIRSSRLGDFVDELLKCAVRYAQIRTEWAMASHEERLEMDASRTGAHNAFIDACNILSRSMQTAGEANSWRTVIGNDRKAIGDFACLLHCLLGIQAR